MRDHEELGDLLGRLIAALDANDITRSHANLDLFWARLAMHIRAEHLHLFPAITNALSEGRQVNSDAPSPNDAQSTIEELRHDHDFFMRELSQSMLTMRSLLANDNQQIAGALEGVRMSIAAVKERLAHHNEIEEQGIYVWTMSLLSEAEQSALASLVRKELENTPPRFRAKSVPD